MAKSNDEKKLTEALKRIKANSPRVEFNIEDVTNYLSGLEKKVGTTENFDCAGYILPNGKLLDLSLKDVFEDYDRVLAHDDMIYYGYDSEEIKKAGAILIGGCEEDGFYFIDINTINYTPTEEQYKVLDDILMKNPNKLCVEATIDNQIENKMDHNFAKIYDFSKGDTSKDIQTDINNFLNGDRTYIGEINEVTGEEIRPAQ